VTKARQAFDFNPATPLADGLAATWHWFLSQTTQDAIAAG
jgi:hypothetical protein